MVSNHGIANIHSIRSPDSTHASASFGISSVRRRFVHDMLPNFTRHLSPMPQQASASAVCFLRSRLASGSAFAARSLIRALPHPKSMRVCQKSRKPPTQKTPPQTPEQRCRRKVNTVSTGTQHPVVTKSAQKTRKNPQEPPPAITINISGDKKE